MLNTYEVAAIKPTVLAPEEPYRYLARLERTHLENIRKQSSGQALKENRK